MVVSGSATPVSGSATYVNSASTTANGASIAIGRSATPIKRASTANDFSDPRRALVDLSDRFIAPDKLLSDPDRVVRRPHYVAIERDEPPIGAMI
jgi:hypothetical protein